MFYILLVIFLTLILFVYYIQYTLIYPGSLIKDNENLDSKMEILDANGHKSYYIKPITNEDKERKLWIFFTGNNMIAKTYYKIAKKIQKNNKNDIMLLFEYPSYGINNKCGELNMYDINNYIITSIKALKKKYTFNKINLFAWSLGCAVALNYARNVSLNNIYLLSPFTTFQDAIYNVLGGIPLHYLLSSDHKWNNLESILSIKAKKVEFFHGTLDKIVPFEHGLNLFDKIPEKIDKKFNKLEGARHNIFKLINYDLLL